MEAINDETPLDKPIDREARGLLTTPISPNSAQEWELEQQAFIFANDTTLSRGLRAFVKALWLQFCLREKWLTQRDEARSNFDLHVVWASDEITAARALALEEAARIVENGQETWSNEGDANNHYLTPRIDGNRAGLSYAAAIRQLQQPQGEDAGR